MDPPAYRALRQMNEDEAREASGVAIGVPLIAPPQQTRAEYEAWVAIGVPVPLIEPRSQTKPRPCEKHLTRCVAIAWGIISTVLVIQFDGPIIAKILGTFMVWAMPIGILRVTFKYDDLPDNTVET